MSEVKEYIRKIVDEGSQNEMEELSMILDEAVCVIKDYDEDLYKDYLMRMYRMAYGNVLSRSMAEDIVKSMKPYGMRWSLDETKRVQEDYGLSSIRDVDFFVVINSAYNDYRDLFGDNLENYVRFTRNFINDEDAKEGKVFLYFTTIPD